MSSGNLHYPNPAVDLHESAGCQVLMIHVEDTIITITTSDAKIMAALADQLCRPAEAIHGERWAVLDGSR
jgi:hypothetical protein